MIDTNEEEVVRTIMRFERDIFTAYQAMRELFADRTEVAESAALATISIVLARLWIEMLSARMGGRLPEPAYVEATIVGIPWQKHIHAAMLRVAAERSTAALSKGEGGDGGKD